MGKTTRIFTLLALIVLVLASCSGEKEPKELYDEQKSGVCMVLNSYYYEITLPMGNKWYCSGIDDEGDLENLTLNLNEVKKAVSTGTAFFIGDKGQLLTNRHVVSPVIPEDGIRKAAKSLIVNIKDYFKSVQDEYARQYNQLEQAKSNCYDYDFYGNIYINQQQYDQIVQEQNQLEQQFNEAENLVNTIDNMDMSALQVKSVNEIGIAYNDSYVTKIEDFIEKNPCVVTDVSEDENTDLAVIQLKNKTTPSDKHIFTIKGYNDKSSDSFWPKLESLFSPDDTKGLQVDQELVMMGFNAGLILGNTKQGVKVQMTTGRVSQEPDGDKVLYSIPMLPGSSGSPVLDLKGNVRAVNFAKLSGTETFNFGIPEKRILKFLNQ